jgi:uncharacterized membrane protein
MYGLLTNVVYTSTQSVAKIYSGKATALQLTSTKLSYLRQKYKTPRTTLQLQVKWERTHRKKKTNGLKNKRDQLVERKKFPSIYRK